MATDPVCGMAVKVEEAHYTSQYQGQTYYFCSPGCKRSFDADPARYRHQQHTESTIKSGGSGG
jgi:YHS domain-containing protein